MTFFLIPRSVTCVSGRSEVSVLVYRSETLGFDRKILNLSMISANSTNIRAVSSSDKSKYHSRWLTNYKCIVWTSRYKVIRLIKPLVTYYSTPNDGLRYEWYLRTSRNGDKYVTLCQSQDGRKILRWILFYICKIGSEPFWNYFLNGIRM